MHRLTLHELNELRGLVEQLLSEREPQRISREMLDGYLMEVEQQIEEVERRHQAA